MLVFIFKHITSLRYYVKTSNRLFLFTNEMEDQFLFEQILINLEISEDWTVQCQVYRSYLDNIIKLNVLFLIGHYQTEKPLLVTTLKYIH